MNAKPETIADRLRAARAARGVSQSALAKGVKLTRGAVGQWEMGVTEPSREKLRDAAAFLRVSKNWLETGEGSGPGSADTAHSRGEGERVLGAVESGNRGGDAAEAWVIPDAFIREATRGPVTRLLSIPAGSGGEAAFIEVTVVGRLVHGARRS
jgi:transcriptional regulator with XRE-family HTH domain